MTAIPLWIAVPALLAVAAAVVLAWRRDRQPEIPVAGARSLSPAARRTAALRVGLVLAIGGVLAAAFVWAPRPTGELDELVGSGRDTVVVLDLSQSVTDLVYREIARTLEGVVTATGDSGRVGLILFSDVAEEALPPGSKATELAPFIHYFRPREERGLAPKPISIRRIGAIEELLSRQYPLNPWFGRFSGGTQISTGLRAARVALSRPGLSGGRVILVSDLAEAEYDLGRLTRELVAYSRDPGLELRVVALPPLTERQKEVFWRITGDRDAIVDSLSLATGNGGVGEPSQRIPVAFVVLAGLLGLALAVNELAGVPLSWRRPSEAMRQ